MDLHWPKEAVSAAAAPGKEKTQHLDYREAVRLENMFSHHSDITH